MCRMVPRSAFASALAIFAAFAALTQTGSSVGSPRAADATAAAIDLSEYRTVATAQTATPAALVGAAERQPGYLGVNAEVDAGGLRVAAVQPESPAARADIHAGDHLQTMDGRPIGDLAELRDVLFNRHEGDRFVVKGTRDNKPVEFVVTLGSPSHPMSINSQMRRVVLGIQLIPADKGVKIDRVTPNMPAERAGVKVGDVLIKVGSAAIASQAALQDALNGHRPGDRVQLTLRREGKEVAVERNCPPIRPSESAATGHKRTTCRPWPGGMTAGRASSPLTNIVSP